MKKYFRLNQRTIRIIMAMVFLTLFVLAAGAPSGMGGVGMNSVGQTKVGGQCRMSVNAMEKLSMNAPVHICWP
mgnify:FL=1